MGERGKPKRPTVIEMKLGNPGKRTPRNEPQPREMAEEEPPAWIGEYGLELWKRLKPQLLKLNLLTEIDWLAFASLCHAYDVYRDAIVRSRMQQPVQTVGKMRMTNAEYSQVKDARAELIKIARQFGLTPSSRAGLNVTSNDGKDEIDAFEARGAGKAAG